MATEPYYDLLRKAQDAGVSADAETFIKSAYDLGLMACAEHWEAALMRPAPAAGSMRQPLERLYRKTEKLREDLKESEERLTRTIRGLHAKNNG